MARLISISVHEADLEWTLRYTSTTLQNVFNPLVHELANRYASESARPYCVVLSGPPGCGKSATAAVLKEGLLRLGVSTHVLPLDGFHMTNETLKNRYTNRGGQTVSLYTLKGAPETYDLQGLETCLHKLRAGERFYWPLYSRVTHEPEAQGILIENPHCLYIIEGNYLLLQNEPWGHLRSFFNRAIFIQSKERLLKRRIVARKKRGGYSAVYARRQYRQSDRCNIEEVLTRSGNWDHLLLQTGRYTYEKG
jgi:pantothenate kinase